MLKRAASERATLFPIVHSTTSSSLGGHAGHETARKETLAAPRHGRAGLVEAEGGVTTTFFDEEGIRRGPRPRSQAPSGLEQILTLAAQGRRGSDPEAVPETWSFERLTFKTAGRGER